MSLARFIRSAFMRRYSDVGRLERRRARREAARRSAGRPHEVLYFHQPDDPYSQLAAQALPAFLQRYDVQLRAHVVAEAAPVAIHDRALWNQWARRECAAMAPYYGLSFRDAGREPEARAVELARRILLNVEHTPAFVDAAIAVDAALNAGDVATLDALAARPGAVDAARAQALLQANFALRHKLRHYLGAMFFYEGDWYWGIDRLPYLEARLDALGARRPGAPAGLSAPLTRRAPQTIASTRRVTLEYFPSVRSPYTHISYARVAGLCRRYPIDLVVRPVLPMMMRGVKADQRKGEYIIYDTKREADRLGVPFGNIWDPFGDPVKRAYSLFPFARERGKAFEYLHAYSMAVWSERLDASGEPGLRTIVERAGLSWDEAKAHLDSKQWEAEVERNVNDMIAAGSWGVPTLRLPAQDGSPEFTVWGQDRIWLIEEEIAKRLQS
jgi:2-hydroxychromene-2-carboxylate isomerase